MEEVKFKVKFLLKETLKGMPLNSELTIKNEMFKENVVRNAATNLKSEGFLFEVSSGGRIDDVVVKRLK